MTEFIMVHEKATQPITCPFIVIQKPAWSLIVNMILTIDRLLAVKKDPISRFSWGIGNGV